MHYKVILIVAFIFFSFHQQSFSQSSFRVKGSVADSTLAPVAGANVFLIAGADTLKTISDKDGNFSFAGLRNNSFALQISSIGYSPLSVKFTKADDKEELLLAAIKLKYDIRLLKEVIIKRQTPPVTFKKDTTEYDVASFGANDKDPVEELLKKLPGVEVDQNGTVKSEGKQVVKLRVNGEDFFTGNVEEYIKQLPVGILSKVQIINDYGDDAAFSGIKNAPSTKMINLVTKPGMNNGVFGNVGARAGSNKLFGGSATGNFWQDATQITGTADLKTIANVTGANVYNKANANVGKRIGKHVKINLGYNFNSSRSSADNDSFLETVNTLGLIDNHILNSSYQKGANHTFNFNSKYDPNPKTYAKLNLSFSLSNSTDSSFSNSQQTGLIKQGLITHNAGTVKTPSGNLDLTVGRRLTNKGPLLMANVRLHSGKVNDLRTINRNITYYDTAGVFAKDSVFNSRVANKTHTTDVETNITLSQSLGAKTNLDLNYSYSHVKQSTSLLTDELLGPDEFILIDSLSNSFNNTHQKHLISLNFRYTGKKLSMTEGITFQRNSLSGIYAGRFNRVRNSTYNFSPLFNLTYAPSEKDNLDLRYSGYSDPPSVDQLQPVQDTRNIQNIIIGNPDLKPSFNHQLDLGFRHYGLKSNTIILLGLTGSYIQNQITNNTVIVKDTLDTYKQITTFLNADGTYTAGANYGYSLPLPFTKNKVKLSLIGTATVARQVVYADNVKTANKISGFSQMAKLTGSFKNIVSEGSVNYSTTDNQYSIGQGLSNRISHLTIALSENIKLYKFTTFNVDANKSIVKGYTNVNSTNPLIVNSSLTQLLLKNRLTLRFQASDIFNQANRLSQTVYGNSIINNRSNYITRSFILSAAFNISKFGSMK